MSEEPEYQLRDIKHVNYFRKDISPFLVHFTKDGSGYDSSLPEKAYDKLLKILDDMCLKSSRAFVSSVAVVVEPEDPSKKEDIHDCLRAVCFSETPLSQIHCLLDIKQRSTNYAPYGLVLLKKSCEEQGACPVLYVERKDSSDAPSDGFSYFSEILQQYPRLDDRGQKFCKEIIPLINSFPLGVKGGYKDFRWEREWRYPKNKGDFGLDNQSIFAILCDHNQIPDLKKTEQYEQLGESVPIIDLNLRII